MDNATTIKGVSEAVHVNALRRWGVPLDRFTWTSTTITFHGSAAEAVAILDAAKARYVGRPVTAAATVRRKFAKAVS